MGLHPPSLTPITIVIDLLLSLSHPPTHARLWIGSSSSASMAMLALPFVISILKPHNPRLSVLCTNKQNHSRFYKPLRRHFTNSVAATTTSAVPKHQPAEFNSKLKRVSAPTFQQAIQRLQVIPPLLITLECLLGCWEKMGNRVPNSLNEACS